MCLPKKASGRRNQDKTEQYRILGLTMFASGKRWNKGNGGRGWSGARVGREMMSSPPEIFEYFTRGILTPIPR